MVVIRLFVRSFIASLLAAAAFSAPRLASADTGNSIQLHFLDVATSRAIDPVTPGVTYSHLPRRVTIIADIPAQPSEVRVAFTLFRNGRRIYQHIEWTPVYALFTNVGDHFKGRTLADGQYKLTTDVLSGFKAEQRTLLSSTVQFNVKTAKAVPTPRPTRTPAHTPTKAPTKAPTHVPTPAPTCTPTAIPTHSPTPSPTPISRPSGALIKGFAHLYAHGFTDMNNTVTLLRDEMGAHSIRSWMVIDWNNPPPSSAFDNMRWARSQGFITVVVFNLPENSARSAIPTPDQAKNYFAKAAAAANGAVDYWEIMNEINLLKYWPGTLSEYVTDVLAPASAALHGAHELVVAASTDQSTSAVSSLVNLGYLKYADAVAYHPYSQTVEEHVANVKKVRQLIGSKPLFLTEWNLFGGGSCGSLCGQWAQMDLEAYSQVKDIADGIWYYNAVYNGGGASKSAPYDNAGQRRFPYFCSVYQIMRGVKSTAAECN